TESPHYLNHYRRTVAHNTVLVYQKGERFFWGEDLWPAANDGGQRMDSSRFWNTVRSLADWQRTRDLWDRGRIEAFESAPGAYPDATVITFQDGAGRLRVHPVLPVERELVARGGPGWEFWTPGDEFGDDWGSGKNWPLDPPEGGPLPADPYLKKMWTTFWGEDL